MTIDIALFTWVCPGLGNKNRRDKL